MTHSIISSNNLKQVMNRSIFLVVLLSSANVLAETRVIPVYKTMQVNCVNEQTTIVQAADPDKTVKLKTSTCKGSSRSRPDSARRVSLDDFEHVLGSVTRPKETEMVWLGQQK